ncbi:MAG: hypothetical protein BWK77_06320 [Verrucomicrobia bacterium A1]|nr:MAG: hypothetical protein BWK77_06320 [Verrucomicrobia bacterium A1]
MDTSVLFAATYSETGGSRVLFKLGEARALALLVSPQVLREAEGALKRKAPESLASFTVLLERTNANVGASAPEADAKKWAELTNHLGDARVIADAVAAEPDYLVTLDKEHLLGNSSLRKQLPFPMGTPGEFLLWFRARVSPTSG